MSRLNRSLLTVALIPTLALAGCGSGSSDEASQPATTAEPEVLQDELPSESPAPEMAPNEEGHRANDTVEGTSADACLTENLDISLSGAEGNEHEVEFKNLGEECKMIGFPEVSLIGDGNGRQIGAPAARSNARSNEVVLDTDESATATLTVEDAAASENCALVSGDGLRVTPPANTNSLFVPAADIQGCDNPDISSLAISPVE